MQRSAASTRLHYSRVELLSTELSDPDPLMSMAQGRKVLSSPSSTRRVLSLSVPHTPRLQLEGESMQAVELRGKPARHKRTLAQPLVLSDSSDSSSDGAAPAGRRREAAISVQTLSLPKKGRGKAAMDKEKFRKVLRDEDEDAGPSARQGQVGKMRTNIMDDIYKAEEAALFANRVVDVAPSGPQKSPRRPREHRDVLRSRGSSLPVSRVLSALCYDVGGFMCVAPHNMTSTTNLRCGVCVYV